MIEMIHMKLKSPGLLNVNWKGLRGLISQTRAYQLRPQVFFTIPAVILQQVPVKPGEETEVTVKVAKLQPNANVKTLIAKLAVSPFQPGQTGLPPLEQSAEVTKNNQSTDNFTVSMKQPLLPRNLTVRFDGGDVFWTIPGDTMQKVYESPNLAQPVNDYLDKLPPGTGDVFLRFLVKSDTHGSVNISIDEENIEYSLIQTQTWENEMDNTIRFDRNIQLDYGSVETLVLNEITDQVHPNISINRIEMDIGGEVGPERLLGRVSTYHTREFATISSEYSAAQQVRLDTPVTPVRCKGITGFFQADAEAEVYIEIQEDTNGFPSQGPPLAKSTLTLAPASPGSSPQNSTKWWYSGFEEPADLETNTPYWIIIKSVRGSVRLGLSPRQDYLENILFNRGGQLWKEISAPGSNEATVGQLRLVYIPGLDNQTAAIEIGTAGTGALKKIDLEAGSEAQVISLEIPDDHDKQQVVIVVKSHAQGMLSIANVIQEYSPA
ncbi:MAG: hypothetical protein PVH61_25750 [Candidatus Aminicenantes bacterium]|jgi:hypothetical protein